MGKERDGERDIREALADSGFTDCERENLMKALKGNEWKKAKKLLLSKRTELLGNIHTVQNQMFCIDLVIRKVEKEEKNK